MKIQEAAGTVRTPGGAVAALGPELAQLVVVGLWASTFIVTKHAFAELTPLASPPSVSR
jgi:hypothetical protein